MKVKKLTGLILAAALLLSAMGPFAFSFGALAAVLPAPAVSDVKTAVEAKDVLFSFTVSAPDALAYETYRRQTYETVRKDYTDEQIAHSNQSWLLYPAVLLCELTLPDGESYAVAALPAETAEAKLSLVNDILPGLAAGGGYTPESFSFTLQVSAAAQIGGTYTKLSETAGAGGGVCPATVHIDYVLPAGTDNSENPSFLYAPLSEPLTLAWPTLTGHTFAGWQTEGGIYVDSVPAGTRETRLYARFTPRTYKINYVLTTRPGYMFNRVSNTANPKSYTYGEITPLYPVNAPSGYAFGGWFRTEDLSGEEVTAIGPEELGDVLLYARWLTEADLQEEELRKAGWGDLNDDGDITAADARLALRAAVGLETLSSERIARADFARLGRLTSVNARLLLRIAVGLDTLTDVLKEHGRLN